MAFRVFSSPALAGKICRLAAEPPLLPGAPALAFKNCGPASQPPLPTRAPALAGKICRAAAETPLLQRAPALAVFSPVASETALLPRSPVTSAGVSWVAGTRGKLLHGVFKAAGQPLLSRAPAAGATAGRGMAVPLAATSLTKAFAAGDLGITWMAASRGRPLHTLKKSLLAFACEPRIARLLHTGSPSGGPRKFRPVLGFGGILIGLLLMAYGSQLEDIVDEDGLPVNLDWSTLGLTPPIYSDFSAFKCGSCWAIVAVQAAESVNRIVNGDYTLFSIQQIIDCVPDPPGELPYGCFGGFPIVGFKYMIEVGLTTAEAYRVNGLQGRCRAEGKPIVFRLDDYVSVPNNELDMKKALLISPITVSVFSNYNFATFRGDAIIEFEDSPPNPSGRGANHAVLLVGYGKDKKGNKYWKVQNVWGKWWGHQGFAKVRRGGSDPRGPLGIMERRGFRPVLYSRSDVSP